MDSHDLPKYAAARITMLDRSDGSAKMLMLYPITEVVFLRADATEQFIVRVSENGDWIIGTIGQHPCQSPARMRIVG